MAISNKQRIAMAVIVVVGLLGGGAVLMSERSKAGSEQAEHSESGHDEKEAHEGVRSS